MKLDLHDDIVLVVLSRRNLLALLHKLHLPGSARTLICGDNNLNGEPARDLVLVVQVEDDEQHYGTRLEPPGPMHPATERALALEQAQRARRPAVRSRSISDSETLH